MRFCKYCGTQISETESICPNCGKELHSNTPDTGAQNKVASKGTNNTVAKLGQHSKTIIGAIIAVVCVIVVAIVINSGKCKASGCHNKTVSGSDYCYSHKCAVSTCKNSRFSYSNYCYSHYLIYDDDATDYTGNQVYSYELKISNVTLSSNSSYTIAEGTVTNNSDKTVSYVKIKGSFETSSGKVVDTDWTYAVGSEGLAPGESCKWRMSVSKDYSIKNCSVTILDFDY
jgi:hypothetical protein